jgi:glycosyltransferase
MISLFILKPNIRGTQYGIGTYLIQLTNALLKVEDINIFIINYQSDIYKEYKVVSTSPKLIEIFIPTPIIKIRDEKQTMRYATQVVKFLTPYLSTDTDAIFQVNYPDALPIVKQLKSRFSSKIISVIHSAQWHFMFHGNKQKFLENWSDTSGTYEGMHKWSEEEKELYELSDKIVSVTEYMRNFLIKYYCIPSEKIKVICNGIDNTCFQILDKGQKIALKQSLGFDKDEKIVLFSGRIDASKGLYFLLDGFKEIVKRHSNIRLVIIGGDSSTDTISQFLSHCENIWSKVTFTGFLEYEKCMKFYMIADIGILPSIYDHCPYVAIEMIGHNIPLIISNTEGLNEILTENQSIYLTPHVDDSGNLTYDRIEIANAIFSILNDEQKAKQIAKDYPELMRTRFSSQRMAKEMYSVFEKMNLNGA